MTGMLGGKVAIVTGAGAGIGRAEAVTLAAHGAAVLVNDLGSAVTGTAGASGHAAADATTDLIRARGGRADANYADVSDWDESALMIQQAVEQFGGVDILVNNAGIVRRGPVVDMTEHDVDTMMRVLFKGSFAMLHHTARYWRDRHLAGDRRPRSVVNTSSSAGVPGGVEDFSLYGSMKAGVAALTMTAALEWRPYDITVNAICPHAASRMDSFAKQLPFQESDLAGAYAPVDPRHVADLVAWLVSDGARYLTGQVFEVGSGLIRRLHPWSSGAEITNGEGWAPEELGTAMATTIFGTLPSGRTIPGGR